jgi:uncharacterized protein
MRLLRWLGPVLLLAAGSAAFAQTPKLRALIVTGQNTASHDWRATTPVLRKLLEDTGRFDVRVTEDFRGAGPETLASYDVVVVNYYDGKKPELRWGERAEKALVDFVASGKGLVIYHFTTAAFDGWTDFEKLCGGNWRPNNGNHGPRHDFTVKVTDPDHPIVRGLKPELAETNDELYANLRWQPAGTVHVLATARDEKSVDHPMLWTVQSGKGRVFATALGHDVEAMKSEAFVQTFARGTEWAAGQVKTIVFTLPASKV